MAARNWIAKVLGSFRRRVNKQSETPTERKLKTAQAITRIEERVLKKLGVRLEGSATDRLEVWIQESLRPCHPNLEQPLRAAIQAFDTIQERKRISPELLDVIVDAASSSSIPLYETVTGLLSELTGLFVEAQDALLAMANHSCRQVRFNAILCIGESTPRSLSVQILRQGLYDRSAKVRVKAADCIGRMRLRELIPDLEEASRVETNAKAKATMEFELKLLLDGYILERNSDSTLDLTVRIKGGIVGRPVSELELKQRGIEAIVADMIGEPS
jgi:hypothetical protein